MNAWIDIFVEHEAHEPGNKKRHPHGNNEGEHVAEGDTKRTHREFRGQSSSNRNDQRFAQQEPVKDKQNPELAAELVRLRVDIIVSAGPTVTRPTKEATSTIPIVMALDDDPVGSGFVASLARPGGNITGLSTLAPEISGNRSPHLEASPAIGWRTRDASLVRLLPSGRPGGSPD
jgi:ABC transporter substrate binding protein